MSSNILEKISSPEDNPILLLVDVTIEKVDCARDNGHMMTVIIIVKKEGLQDEAERDGETRKIGLKINKKINMK